ncbi:hydrogenase expression/formation protein [Paraburkholderia dinghuensis]|uniref:Hydrogenase expression/formation protein n=1 Tax=Paraburkholderia dinghuensis TaxID=2305225 RepID=A0A3N6MYG8_9BURK|nr:hydrogenase expression/formation protein [Paraburkholderia dinghuensis]RQH07065.1 hydrogenase expression/formation protein [Paraburkholderia dinghuensis]
MSRPFPVPVVTTGPGSQPEPDDWSCLPLPSTVETWRSPDTPDPGEPGTDEVLALLRNMAAALASDPQPTQPLVFPVAALGADAHRLLAQVMGEGEVSAQVMPSRKTYCGAGALVRIQESRYPGIWRVIVDSATGERIDDRIEIGAIPAVILDEAQHSGTTQGTVADTAGHDLMNAPSVATEIVAAQARALARHGAGSHVVNFSLLPVTPADIAWLENMLGAGTVGIFSTGYGKCTVIATGWRYVWRVRYFDGTNKILLDTLDITGIPEVAVASAEDLADSLRHLREIVEWLEQA